MKTIDWNGVRKAYADPSQSVRSIARRFGCSDTAINNKIKEQGWLRMNANPPRLTQFHPPATPLKPSEGLSEDEDELLGVPSRPDMDVVPIDVAPIAEGDYGKMLKNIVGRILHELDVTTTHVGQLERLLYSNSSRAQTAAISKIMDLPKRIEAASKVATILKVLEAEEGNSKDEPEPEDQQDDEIAKPLGKKAQRQANAVEKVAAGNKFAPTRAPRLVADNTK